MSFLGNIKVKNISTTNLTICGNLNTTNINTTNYRTGHVLETVSGFCNGQSIVLQNCTLQFQNVAIAQTLTTTSIVDFQGSIISYTPPVGTNTVIYEFTYQASRQDSSHGIHHPRFFIDGVEQTGCSPWTVSRNAYEEVERVTIPIRITGSTSATEVTVASWDTTKELKLRVRDYDGDRTRLHEVHSWNGTESPSVEDAFAKPILTLTALA